MKRQKHASRDARSDDRSSSATSIFASATSPASHKPWNITNNLHLHISNLTSLTQTLKHHQQLISATSPASHKPWNITNNLHLQPHQPHTNPETSPTTYIFTSPTSPASHKLWNITNNLHLHISNLTQTLKHQQQLTSSCQNSKTILCSTHDQPWTSNSVAQLKMYNFTSNV